MSFVFRFNPTRSTDALRPGEWMRWTCEFSDRSRILAVVCCPYGHAGSFDSKIHSIGHGGIVSPSYVCHRAGCPFHEFVVLAGWS